MPTPTATNVTAILAKVEAGDSAAAEQLLPLIYHELRKLAAAKLRHEKPGQTLQATALVHEAFLRLVDSERLPQWNSRGHFFAAAAEAMRRILVEAARRRKRLKRGGGRHRQDVDEIEISAPVPTHDVLAIDAALQKLSANNPAAAELTKLRYFAGFTNQEAAEILGVSPRKATQLWAYARAWLLAEIETG